MSRVGLAACGAVLAATAAQAADVTVEVRNVRNAKGHVRVAICHEDEFLKPRCTFDAAVPSMQGTTTVTFHDIPPGTYAAQGYLDEHDWEEVRRDVLGFPEQGIGFSNDAPISFGPPKWDVARFAVGAAPVQVHMTLIYFTL